MNKILIIIVVVFILIQLIPVDHDNPPVKPGNEIELASDVKGIIENSCYDCHSNNSEWPWYSYVAPVSWFVAGHVHEARGELNFSEWNSYNNKRKEHKLKELVEEIEEDEMPLPSYLIMHEKAYLTEEQKQILIDWAKSSKEQDTLAVAK